MNISDIIDRKEDYEELTKQEIEYVVNNYVNGSINDKDMSLFLKAIYKNGMNEEETLNLTIAMLNSGKKIDLSSIKGVKVDKHSTGGVGDKTTLVIVPLVATCGIPVVKMSGKALGYTGGTIDKLNSIRGFNTSLTVEQLLKQAEEIGIVVGSQTGNLVPADKKIYALRDVTDTIESLPLIASSIMSKKLASGCDKILLDVKVGNGAFMKDLNKARELASLMVKIGNSYGKETIALLTNMNEPLGNVIGNSLEVEEAIKTLEGKGPTDFTKLCIELASHMVSLGKRINVNDARKLVNNSLYNGNALNKFKEWISYQGGDLTSFPKAKNIIEVKSNKFGYINKINTEVLGEVSMSLGAGRVNKDDEIDYSVGLILNHKLGDYVKKGDILIYIHTNKDNNEKEINLLKSSFIIGDKDKIKKEIILDIIK
ncbi:MAG: thymidine phosphorylase [Bacilli bacterium]